MPEPTVAPDVHEAFDVHGNLGSQRTLHLEVALDLPADTIHVFVGEIMSPDVRTDPGGAEDLARPGPSYPEDVGEGDLDPFSTGEIHTCDSCHGASALPLLMTGVALANDPHHPTAANYLAVLANRLNAASDLHSNASRIRFR